MAAAGAAPAPGPGLGASPPPLAAEDGLADLDDMVPNTSTVVQITSRLDATVAIKRVAVALGDIDERDAIKIVADEVGSEYSAGQHVKTLRKSIVDDLSRALFAFVDEESADEKETKKDEIEAKWDAMIFAVLHVTGQDGDETVEDDACAEVSAILSRRIQSITAGKYSRRQQEWKVYLHRTGKADGTPRERRMWNLLVPPSGAREGFNPHAHDGAARRSDIKLDVNFVIRDWFDFISSCKIGGLLKGIGSLAGYRSAFNDAWSQQVVDRGVARPPGMDEAVKIFFTGLAKKDAEERLTGLRKQKVGKDQLPQPAFRYICSRLLQAGTKAGVFAHCFLAIAWSLMCRLNNVDSIHGHHLAWAGDCFTVTFSSTKTDPTGTSTNDPKHCFSNPLAPEIDLLLALGIYFSVFKHVNEAGPGAAADGAADGAGAGKAYSSPPLFPGSDQQKRFVDILTKVLNEEEVAAVMKRMGVSVTDIAGHSTRKGSATFVSSGSTDGVSYPALCRRCGWKMGVQERYIFLLGAMDRLIGRVVAGLPTGTEWFAILPPHFALDADINLVLEAQFGNWVEVDGLVEVLPFCLAAVSEHYDYVVEHTPSDGVLRHPVLDTPMFTNAEMRSSIASLVTPSGLESKHMEATGIPAHTHIMLKLKEIEARAAKRDQAAMEMHERVIAALGAVSKAVAKDVRTELDERSEAMGQMTPSAMKAAMEEMFEKNLAAQLSCITKTLGLAPQGPAPEPHGEDPIVQDQSVDESPFREWSWQSIDESEIKANVPPDWVWTDRPMEIAIGLWLSGNSDRGIVPYRDLDPRTFPVNNHPKYYELPFVLEQMTRSSQAKAKVVPTTAAQRVRKAQTQTTSFNNWGRLIRMLFHEQSTVDELASRGYPNLLEKLETEDPFHVLLPTGAMLRYIPTFHEISELYRAAYITLQSLGLDNNPGQKRKRTRPAMRNIGTWDRLLRESKKAKHDSVAENASDDDGEAN
eukprot:m.68405 g.68405  ORF g.68405 m.68405 type:complete len:977 (-) comp18312_c0_seq2:125-3055(-)